MKQRFAMVGKRGTKIYSVINLKCPRCHYGNLFICKNPFVLRQMLDMPDHCPVCQQDFRMEPGFYSGALWTSYPLVVFIMILLGILVKVLFDPAVLTIFIIVSLIVLVLQPVIMRLGRAIWINIFVNFRG